MLGLKAKLAAFGLFIVSLSALILRVKFLKNKAERLERTADTLKARHAAEQTKKRMIKKEKERLVSRRADIVKEIKKDDEEFTGVSTLGEGSDDF